MSAVQGQLPGMPARLFSCTPTRLTTWLDCPRRYRMTYVDRPMPPKGPPWAHTAVGAAVHVALASWWSEPPGERTAPRAAALVRKAWQPLGFSGPEQSGRWRERSAIAVERYAARLDPADEPLGVERTVGTRTATLAVSGRVDRIDERDGESVVVDYKVGRWVPDTHEARSSLALALYAVATERTLRRPCRTVELHHVPTDTVVRAEHTPESLARKVSEAESIATDVVAATARHAAGDASDAVFPPSPSRMCSWCDFRRHCPEGREAAPDVEPWAALRDDVPGDAPAR